MQDKQKGGHGQIKKLVSGLDSNRKNVQSGNDISSNIAQAKQSFNEFEGIIRGQTSTISSIKAFQKSMASQNSRTLQVKKFFLGFADNMKVQIGKFMKLTDGVFTTSNQKSNKEDDLQKMTIQLTKILNSIKQQSDTSQKMYSGVYKLLNIRDNIICQFLRVMLYKKNVLWRDLNIKFDDYIHGQVKAMLNKIKENQQKYGYIPSSISFKIPKFQAQIQSPLADLISIILQDQDQLIDSMKNFSKLSEQPQLIEDISKNQHVVKGLRQKIEVLTKNYNSLLQKYRSLQISKGKVQLGANQQKSLNERLEDMQALLLKKEQDIIQLKQTAMKSDGSIQSLKDKIKQLQDEISKWQNLQLPKIKQLQLAQKTLLDQFSKTKKDFQTYSNLYQNQRQDKLKAYSDLKDEKNRLYQMANILGRERRNIKQLKAQLQQKDKIIFQLVEKAPDP